MSTTTTTMMKIVSKKMIKPCTPTPQNLRNYKISFTDQSVPSMNIQIILFYSPSPSTDLDITNISHLENSLSNILPRFYPLAGRYIRKDHLVLCNDDGVEFVGVHACSDNFRNISEYVKTGMHEQLNDTLLPRLSREVDEVTDPIVSIQVTRFGCGGVAIGLSVSHRIVDADSISTFIRAWAEEAKSNPRVVVNPSFDSPALLPLKNFFPGSERIQLPRTVDPNITSKRFSFNKGTIATLKAKIRDRSRRVSKVGVVCAFISEAVIRADRLKHRNIIIVQAVNIRDRTIPPFPKHSCGNLVAGAKVKFMCPSNDSVDGDDDRKLIIKRVGFEDLVSLLREAIDKTIVDCASLFHDGGLNVLYGTGTEMTQAIMRGGEETKIFCLTDWSKFEYYEADFGWGKPIWTSIGTMPVNNNVVLMGNKEGDGIEAWVHMFKEDMVLFEQEIIKI